ncbi:hypothetical protein [Leuconostoc citreum]|uniref:hypothetical protein n=1 Tax=Leuconostoc citreum TaxID=33964 RepID=UPI0032DF8F81
MIYRIYRGEDIKNQVKIAEVKDKTTFIDSKVVPDKTYFYSVSSFDGVNESNKSNIIEAQNKVEKEYAIICVSENIKSFSIDMVLTIDNKSETIMTLKQKEGELKLPFKTSRPELADFDGMEIPWGKNNNKTINGKTLYFY